VAGALRLGHVVPFRSPFYRIGLLLLVATAGVALLVSIWRRRGRASSAAIAMIATSAICFTLLCVAPDSINGSAYFPDRFAILWSCFLSRPLPRYIPAFVEPRRRRDRIVRHERGAAFSMGNRFENRQRAEAGAGGPPGEGRIGGPAHWRQAFP